MLTVLVFLAALVLLSAIPAVVLLRQHHRTDLDRQMRRLNRQQQEDPGPQHGGPLCITDGGWLCLRPAGDGHSEHFPYVAGDGNTEGSPPCTR